MNPYATTKEEESLYNPFTFRQIRDSFNSRPGVFADASLASYASGLNQMFNTNQFNAATIPALNVASDLSVRVDDWLNTTGLPDQFGDVGERFGEPFGFGQVGREVFQQVPRQFINYAPMFAGGLVGAGLKTAGSAFLANLGGAALSAPLVGADVFEKSGDLGSAAVSAGLTAATPLVFGVGGAVGEMMFPKATGFAQRLANYVGGNVALNTAFIGADVAQNGVEILADKNYWAAQALGNIPFLALDLPDLLMPKKVIGDSDTQLGRSQSDPTQLPSSTEQVQRIQEQQRLLAEQQRNAAVRTDTTTQAADIINESRLDPDDDAELQKMFTQQMDNLRSLRGDLNMAQESVLEQAVAQVEEEQIAITLDLINQAQNRFLDRIRQIEKPQKRVALKQRLDEVVTALVAELRTGSDRNTVLGEDTLTYLKRKRKSFVSSAFSLPANEGLNTAWKKDVNDINAMSGPVFTDRDIVHELYLMYGGDETVDSTRFDVLVGETIPATFDEFRQMIENLDAPSMLATQTNFSKLVRSRFNEKLNEFFTPIDEIINSTTPEPLVDEIPPEFDEPENYEIVFTADLAQNEVILVENEPKQITEITQEIEDIKITFSDGQSILVDADSTFSRFLPENADLLAEDLTDVLTTIDFANEVNAAVGNSLVEDESMASMVESQIDQGVDDFEEAVQRVNEQLRGMTQTAIDSIPTRNDVDELPYNNSPNDTADYIESLGEDYNNAEVRHYVNLIEIAHIEGVPNFIEHGVEYFVQKLKTDRPFAMSFKNKLEARLNAQARTKNKGDTVRTEEKYRKRQKVVDTIKKFQSLGIIRSFSNGRKSVELVSAAFARYGAFREKSTGTIYISAAMIVNGFDNKIWTKPRKLNANGDSVLPMHKDAFLTIEDWTKFVLYHERLHEVLLRNEGESLVDYENRINAEAKRLIGVEADGRTAEIRVILGEIREELNGNRPTTQDRENRNKKINQILFGKDGIIPKTTANYKSVDSVIGDIRRRIGLANKAFRAGERKKGETLMKDALNLQRTFLLRLIKAIDTYPQLRFDLTTILETAGAIKLHADSRKLTVADQRKNSTGFDFPAGLPQNVVLVQIDHGWAVKRAGGEIEVIVKPQALPDFTHPDTLQAVQDSINKVGGLSYPELERLYAEHTENKAATPLFRSIRDFEAVEGPLAKQPITKLQLMLQNFLNVVDTTDSPEAVIAAADIVLKVINSNLIQVQIDNQAAAIRAANKGVAKIQALSNIYVRGSKRIVESVKKIVQHYKDNPPKPIVRPEKKAIPFQDARLESSASPFRSIGKKLNKIIQKFTADKNEVFVPSFKLRSRAAVLFLSNKLVRILSSKYPDLTLPMVKFRYFDMTQPAENVSIFHPLLRAFGVVDFYMSQRKARFVNGITKDHAGPTGILQRGKKLALETMRTAGYPEEAVTFVETLYNTYIDWSNNLEVDKEFFDETPNKSNRANSKIVDIEVDTLPDVPKTKKVAKAKTIEPKQTTESVQPNKTEKATQRILLEEKAKSQMLVTPDLLEQIAETLRETPRELLVSWWKHNTDEGTKLAEIVYNWANTNNIKEFAERFSDFEKLVNFIIKDIGLQKTSDGFEFSLLGLAAFRRLIEQTIILSYGHDPKKITLENLNQLYKGGKIATSVTFIDSQTANDVFDEGPLRDFNPEKLAESRKKGDYKRIKVIYPGDVVNQPKLEVSGDAESPAVVNMDSGTKPIDAFQEATLDSMEMEEIVVPKTVEEQEVQQTAKEELQPEITTQPVESLPVESKTRKVTARVLRPGYIVKVDGKYRTIIHVLRDNTYLTLRGKETLVVQFEPKEIVEIWHELDKKVVTDFLDELSPDYNGLIENWQNLHPEEVKKINWILGYLGIDPALFKVIRDENSNTVFKVDGEGVTLNASFLTLDRVTFRRMINEEIFHLAQRALANDFTPEAKKLKADYLRLMREVPSRVFDKLRPIMRQIEELYKYASRADEESLRLELEAKILTEFYESVESRSFLVKLKNYLNRIVNKLSGGLVNLNVDNLIKDFLTDTQGMFAQHARAVKFINEDYPITGFALAEGSEITEQLWNELNINLAKYGITDATIEEKVNLTRVGSAVPLNKANWRELLANAVAARNAAYSKTETFFRTKFDVVRERNKLENIIASETTTEIQKAEAKDKLEKLIKFIEDGNAEDVYLSAINLRRAEQIVHWQRGFGLITQPIFMAADPILNAKNNAPDQQSTILMERYKTFIMHGLRKFFPVDGQERPFPFIREVVLETLVEMDKEFQAGKPYNFFRKYSEKLKFYATIATTTQPSFQTSSGMTWVKFAKTIEKTIQEKKSDIELITIMSPASWCTSYGAAETYYTRDGIYMLVNKNGAVEAMVAFKFGKFSEWQGPKNDGKYPIEFVQEVRELVKSDLFVNLGLGDSGLSTSLKIEIIKQFPDFSTTKEKNELFFASFQEFKKELEHSADLYFEFDGITLDSSFILRYFNDLAISIERENLLNTNDVHNSLWLWDFGKNLDVLVNSNNLIEERTAVLFVHLLQEINLTKKLNNPIFYLPKEFYSLLYNEFDSLLYKEDGRISKDANLAVAVLFYLQKSDLIVDSLTLSPDVLSVIKNVLPEVTNLRIRDNNFLRRVYNPSDTDPDLSYIEVGNSVNSVISKVIFDENNPFGVFYFAFDEKLIDEKLIVIPGYNRLESGELEREFTLQLNGKVDVVSLVLPKISHKINIIADNSFQLEVQFPENSIIKYTGQEITAFRETNAHLLINSNAQIKDLQLQYIEFERIEVNSPDAFYDKTRVLNDIQKQLDEYRAEELSWDLDEEFNDNLSISEEATQKLVHDKKGFQQVVSEVAQELGLTSAEQKEAYLKRANFIERMFSTPLVEYGRLIASGEVLGQTRARTANSELLGIDVSFGRFDVDGLDAKSAEQLALITQAHEAGHAVEQLAKNKKLSKEAQKSYEDWLHWSNNAAPDERAAVLDILFSKYGKRTTKNVRELLYNKTRMQKLANDPIEFRAYVTELWARGQIDHAGLNPDITLIDMLTYVPREVFNWVKTLVVHSGRILRGMFGIARKYGNPQEGFNKAETALKTVVKSLEEAQMVQDAFDNVLLMGTRGFSEVGIGGLLEERFNLTPEGNQVYSHPGMAGLPRGKSDPISYSRRLASGFVERIENFIHFPPLRQALSSVIQFMSGIASDSTMAMAPIFGGYNQATGNLNAQAGSKRFADVEKLVTDKTINRAFSLIAEEMRERGATQVISGRQLGDTKAGRAYRSLTTEQRRIVDELLPEYVNSSRALFGQVTTKLKIIAVNFVANYLGHKFSNLKNFDEIYQLAQKVVDNMDIIMHPETLGGNVSMLQSSALQQEFLAVSPTDGFRLYQRATDIAARMLKQRDEIQAYFDSKPAFLSTGDFGAELVFVQGNNYDRLDKMFGGLLRKLDQQRNIAIDEMTDLSDAQRTELKQIFDTQTEIERMIASERHGKTKEGIEANYAERLKQSRGQADEFEINVPEAHRRFVNIVTGIMNSQVLNSRLRFEMNRPELQNGQMKLRADQFMQQVQNFKIPDTQIGRWINKALFQYTMGLNLSNHVLELLQPYYSFLPLIISEGDMSPIEAAKFMQKASGEAGQYFASRSGAWVSSGGKDLQNEPWKKIMGAEGQEFFDLFNLFGLKKLISMSYLNDQIGEGAEMLQPMIDARQFASGNKLWKSVKNASGSLISGYSKLTTNLYGHATQHNARTASIIGWRMAKKRMPNEPVYVNDPGQLGKKMLNPKLVAEAELFVVASTFGSGRYGRPSIPFSSNNPVIRTAAMMYGGLQGFSQGMLGMWGRFVDKSFNKNAYPWMTDKERLRARQALATMIAVGFGSAGMMGLPFVGAIMQIIENTTELEPRAKMRELLANLFNEDEAQGGFLTDLATRGGVNALLAQTGIQPDIASRVAIGGMFGMDAYNGFSTDNLMGPSWQIASDLVKGAGEFAVGDWNAGWKDVLPVAFKRPAGLLMDGGELRDMSGAVIADTTWADKFVHAVGFTPQRVSKMREGSRLLRRSRELQMLQDSRWHESLAKQMQTDPQGVRQKLLDRQDESQGRYAARTGAQRVAETVIKQTLPSDVRYDASNASSKREEGILKTMQMNQVQPSAEQRLMIEAQIMQMLGFSPNVTPQKVNTAREIDRIMSRSPWLTYSTAKDLAEHPYGM